MTPAIIVILAIFAWIAWAFFSSKANSGAAESTPGTQGNQEWEGSFWEVSDPLPAKARLRIKYTDASGQKTERTVLVRQFGIYGPTAMLTGHCLMRGATRNFRADRIRSCIDEETGEIIQDVRAHLEARYNASPDKTKDALFEGEYDTLRILLYVGKADGQLRAAELAIIKETCIALAGDSRLTDKDIKDLFSSLDIPTLAAFKMAVGRIAKKDSKSRSTLLQASERMVGTQKTVHPSEAEAIEYMKKRFSAVGESAA